MINQYSKIGYFSHKQFALVVIKIINGRETNVDDEMSDFAQTI